MSSTNKCLLSIVKSFDGQDEDEISVETGQIAQYISKIDKFWYEVYLEDRVGKIPIDCCRQIKPDMLDNLRISPTMKQVIFISKHDFINYCEEGDLKFSRFEVIIGFHPIDNEWWNGARLTSVKHNSNHLIVDDSDCGIFPLTYVWKLRNDLLPDYIFDAKGIILKSLLNKNDSQSEIENPPKVLELEKNKNNTHHLFYVKVIKTMNAQLDEEIDLPELDEIFGITSIVDKLYYQGESLSRKGIKGIFPKGFVKKIDDDEAIQIKPNNSTDCDIVDSSEDNSSKGQSPVPPSFTPPPPPTSQDIPNYKFENSKIIQNDFETDSNDYCQGNEDLPPSYEAALQAQPVAYGYANYMFNEIEPYGRALYDFEAQDNSELSLRQNQIVRLIRYCDQEWMEGEINGQIGLFPRSYISIIVDCKNQLDSTQSMASSSSSSVNNQNPVTAIDYPPNSYAKILYDFDGEMEQDLKIKTGDVVTMLRKFTSTDWIEAQDSSGNIGFVYIDFCQPLQPGPSNSNAESNLTLTNIEEENDTQPSSSLYPRIPVEELEKPKEDLNQDSNSQAVSKVSKPRRAAPAAPRRNNIFPTFNQFLIEEKQEHYQFDIDNNENNESLPQTRRNSNSKSTKNQKQSQRECVIIELIQTEKDYCKSLSVCYQVFNSSSYEAEKCDVDVKKLLSNMQDIIKVSKQLSKLLENYAHNRAYMDQRVGVCFLDLKFDIKESYTQYCRKHDSIHSLLKYYEGNSLSQDYMLNCLRRIQEETNCFDLSSIWIKPVQRILKYPLLLNELIKFTEENHVDYEPLKLAFQMVTDIATYINEYKRRQDLIQKYRRTKDPTLTEKLKNLSMHTFKKKSSRLRHRIISTLTFQSGTKDKDYEAVLNTFQEAEKTIRTTIKDLKEYINLLDNYLVQLMVTIESISEYLDLKQHPRFDYEKIRESYRQMYHNHFKKFSNSIEGNVFKVLTLLLDKFNAPLRLISKREDKRIDYEASLKSKNQDSNLCKNTFEALNQQLIDELPILSETSLKILANCVKSFLHEYRKFSAIIAKYQLDLHELPLLKNTSFGFYQDIEDNFRVKHNLNFEQMIRDFSLIHANSFQESTSALTRFTRNRSSNTWKNALPISKTNQNENQQQQTRVNTDDDKDIKQQQNAAHRHAIFEKYDPEHLYTVINNFEPYDHLMEIPVNRGDLVGVIKYKEPTGSENRWFVDRGWIQGFIPQNLLTRYKRNQQTSNVYDIVNYEPTYDSNSAPEPIEPQRYDTVPDEESDHSSLLSFEDCKKVELAEFDPLAEVHSEDNNYLAAYPFKAAGIGQISLNLNQPVLVLVKHDAKGNQEWWLVQTESNQKGYVPSNYLKKNK